MWIAAVVLIAVPLGVLAHDGMHGPGAEYDADENGSLSLEEFTAHLKATRQDVSKAAQRFAAMDVNKDGKLSSGEFVRGMQSGKPK